MFATNLNFLNKPIFSIGTLGSVSDGKSTLIYQLTGIKTQKHSSEKHKNITIKQGYANLKIWQCIECNKLLSSSSHNDEHNCDECNEKCNLIHHLSFTDSPGHYELLITMMSSVSLMKGAIIVVSASEPINKKPQLKQHLLTAKIAGLEKLIICFNKCDLITKEIALERKQELDKLLNELDIKINVIIPTCFNKRLGINYLLKAIMELFPPEFNDNINNEKPLFKITRSFDINKPGTHWNNINGGIIGGSLIKGTLNIGDSIEIKPGILSKGKDGKYTNIPIKTKILSLETDNIKIDTVNTSALVAIGTDIDPFYCKNDMIIGNLLGLENELPDVYHTLKIKYTPIEIWKQNNGDTVFLQLGNINAEARLIKFKNNIFNFQLIKPVCFDINTNIIVCRKDIGVIKIVGYGVLFNE